MRKLAPLFVLVAASPASAAVKTEAIKYDHDGTQMIGFLAYDDTAKDRRPGVLIFHEWWGLNDYAKKRAEQLAGLGYVAFAADLYGDGKMTEHPEDAGKFATAVRSNVENWRGRAQVALKKFQAQPQVDPHKIAAIGYCFGGTTALQLALTGADVAAVATFHAGLPTPTVEEAKKIKGKVLICNGADDTFVKPETIQKFRSALDEAKVDYKFENLPGAKHSFTVKGVDEKKVPGLEYNEAADKKSWEEMLALFKETLEKK
jgi:dienelactone hydrolase